MKHMDNARRWRRISSFVVILALLLSQWSLPAYPARAAGDNLSLEDTSPDSARSFVDHPRVDTGYGVPLIVDMVTLETDVSAISAAPNVPSNPTPANGATYVMTTTTLSWSGGDPDGDPVTYTVAFGDSSPPPVVDNVTMTTYDPGPLSYNLTYYWQITATDGLSSTAGSLWSFSTASDPENCTLYPSTDTPLPLVDDGVMTSTLTVADSYIVGDVNVTLNISHAYDFDLEMTLIAPDDTRRTLIYRVASEGGQDFLGTMLDDEADINIFYGAPPFTGRFRPADTLDAFDTKNSNGDWRLEIVDHTFGDTGTLNSWQLELCSMEITNRAPHEPHNPWPSDGATDIPTTLSLSWSGGDPDGDPVTYTVAFGDSSPPPVVGNVTATTYDLGPLDYNLTYHWQITATDGMSTTVGPIWSFTTAFSPPAAFGKTSPISGTTGVPISPTLSWDTSTGAVSYEYCYDTTGPSCPGDVWTSTAAITSVALFDLDNGTTYYWQARAVNTGGTTEADGGTWWSFTTANANDAPFFTSMPVTTAAEGTPYTYTVTVDDPDLIWGDALTITAPTLPTWLTLTGQGDVTATLTGTPTDTDTGDQGVVLHVTDSQGMTETQSFSITVAYLNDAPFFTSTVVTTATQDFPYTYAVAADDPDLSAGDALTITAPTLPAWLALTDHGDGAATLAGTPTNAVVGDHAVELRVTDMGGLTGTQAFTITVANVNDAPFFTSAPLTEAIPDALYTYAVTADDPDLIWGDVLTITAPTLPAWLAITDHGAGTATLAGTPTSADAGEHVVELLVTDSGGLTATQPFTITVSYQVYLPLVLRNAS